VLGQPPTYFIEKPILVELKNDMIGRDFQKDHNLKHSSEKQPGYTPDWILITGVE